MIGSDHPGRRTGQTAAALAVLITASIAIAADIYVATPMRDLQLAGPGALAMPTAVAVEGRGSVFVADGVNNRIVQFDENGRLVSEIRAVGERKLSGPVSVKTDADGRLWIADTGNGRVLVRKTDGTLDHAIYPRSPDGDPLDITDILPDPDGYTFWLADNDHHRLARMSVSATDPIFVGSRGESLGRFQYPFLLARSAEGDLLVTDVINARVQTFNSSGQPVGTVGSFGIRLGQLYRPKGVTADAQGQIWVSDGTLGVVQIFTSTGRPVGALQNDQGEPFRFRTPMGLTFDPQGRLYVVEATPGRVRQLSIARQTSAAPAPPPAGPRPPAGQAKSCTICHAEWLIKSPADTELLSQPTDDPEEPFVSRAEVCFGCHDGSVADSRRRVWLEHGHTMGVMPPPSMKVPDALPLVAGKLACRTCHSAHAVASGQEPVGDIATAIFVRMADQAGRLCAACHADKTRGPALGTHPIGGMPWPVPDELVAAGARPGPNPREITCQVCHTPHGAREEHLLVMAARSSQLCLSCHARLRPGLWRPDLPREHPQNPPLSTISQKEAIRQMGTRMGPDETLICLSCHQLHHGQAGRYMLADTLAESRLCLRCHPERSDMLGGSHDLRARVPNERNRLGQTPEDSGPCGACHSFHQFARLPKPGPGDPAGLCATCHAAGQCAENATGLPFSHPQEVPGDHPAAALRLHKTSDDKNTLVCLTCHNPHQAKIPHFLTATTDALCAQCHISYTSMAGTHDFSSRPELRNARQRNAVESGKCGFCHAVHNALGPALWVATDNPPRDADDICLQCHSPSGLAAKSPPELRHPAGPSTAGKVHPSTGSWPLFDADGRPDPQGFLACATCHDMHGNSQADPHLLRAAAPTQDSRWCLSCHMDLLPIETSLHAEHTLRQHLKPHESRPAPNRCGPCHAVHAATTGSNTGMWSGPLGPNDYPRDMRYCLGCHGPGGPATKVHVTIHPTVPMRNTTEAPSPQFLPLIDSQGHLGHQGRMTCQTCHLPHGRAPSRGLPAIESAATEPERRAMATMLRPYVAPNLCSGCHGFEGLRRFLYYHYPEKQTPELGDDRKTAPPTSSPSSPTPAGSNQ